MTVPSTLAQLLSDPRTWSRREALVEALTAELGVEASVAAAIACTLGLREEPCAEGVDQPRPASEDASVRSGDEVARRRQAAEINDNVVQGLTAALYALELNDTVRVGRYLHRTLRAASQMMTDLLEPGANDQEVERTLVRSTPASISPLRTLPLREVGS